MGKPGTSLDEWRDNLNILRWLMLQKLEQGDNMLGSINNAVLHLYFKEHREVNIYNKVYNQLQIHESLPRQLVV